MKRPRGWMPSAAALWAAVGRDGNVFVLLGLFVLLASLVLPISWIVWQIARHPDSMWAELRLDSFRLQLLWRTLLYALSAAALATALAMPAALALGRGRGWISAVLWLVLPVTLLLPSLAYTYGWSQLLRLMKATPDPGGRWDVMRCIAVLAAWLWPLPAGAIGLALRRLDPQVQQQALLDGALWRVTFRQLVGPIVASGAIVAVLATHEFAVWEPTGISVVATEVRMVFDTGAFGSEQNPFIAPLGGAGVTSPRSDQEARATAAVATALPMLVSVALLAALAWATLRRASDGEPVDSGGWPHALDAPKVAVMLAWIILLVTLFTPLSAMVRSLHRPFDPSRLWMEFSPQIIGSITIAAAAGVVGVLLSLAASLRRLGWAVPLGLVGFLIGGQLLAIAQIRIYNRHWLSWVYNAPPIVVMAYVALFGWISLAAASWSFSPRWRQLREMSAVDGGDRLATARYVVWPLIWPALGAAGVLVMILSLTEVPATVLLSPQRPQMLVPMLMTWMHMLRDDAMIEGSLLLCGVVVILALAAISLAWIGRRIFTAGPSAAPPGIVRSKRDAGRRFTLAGRGPACLLLILVAGCDAISSPDEIWCDRPGEVTYPRAIAYSRGDDTFFVVDRLAIIQRLDARGQALNEWRMPQWQLGKPVGLTVGPDGNLYVPDTHYQRVIVYAPDGKEIRRWGEMGRGPGQFVYPTDVAFDSHGRIFVSEYGDNDRIQVFDAEGKFLYQFGQFGQGDGEFSRPQSMVIDGDMLYVTDACNHRIVVFKTDGTFVRNIGSVGSELGQFRFPYGLDLDDRGRLIVCEFGNNRVQLIDQETGRGIKSWGLAGRMPGQLAYPWAVAVDKRERVIAVDAGNNRLQVFEF